MILKDRLEMEKADAKNSVEEYVYEMRDRLETRYSQYISEEVSDVTVLSTNERFFALC